MAPTLFPSLSRRQVVVADGGGGNNNGLDTGAIVGIVIGSIAGILLLWWIIWSCSQPRGRRDPSPDRQGWYDDTRPRSRSRSAHHHHHHHRHGSRRHSRRRSSTSRTRPVILEEKVTGYGVPAQPAQAYVYPSAGSRPRSRSQGRYYTTTGGH